MPAPNSIIGRILGGYVIQSQIGSGGMGVVYRAHDDRLGRTVAIKVLPAKYLADETLKQRFLREGRTAASIDHPNVVRIMSAGEEGGFPYLVMEYVDGGSLQRLLEKKVRLPVARVVRIARQVAEALAAAHKVGVLHRDVKPANVLFTKEGEAKLVDFGLAREELSDVNLSQTGMVMGTPHYMAPEVCAGKKADARADVYALGIVLYAMLALRLPFDAETAIALLMLHIQKPVPPIPEAPPGVMSVLMKSLAKNPAKRWISAAEFAEALAIVEEAPGELLPAVAAVETTEPPPVPSRGAAAAPSIPLISSPLGAATVPGGLLPTEATPTAGVIAMRRRISPAAWVAGGVAVALLAGGSVFLAVRGRNRPPAAPSPIVNIASPVPVPVVPSDGGAWEATLASALAHAADFEAKGEFRRALELIVSLQPPDARATATVSREKKELMRRAQLRVAKEMATPPHGTAGARQLRELAAMMPEEMSKALLDLAAAADRDWQPRDGFAALRGLFASRDIRAMKDALERIEVPSRPDEREALLGARRAAGRFHLLLEAAGVWFKSHAGQEVVIRRNDGTTLAGSVRGVVESAVQISTPTGQVSLGVRDVAIAEFVVRALDGCPPDELLLAAIDSTLLAGKPEEAWPLALQARRRGLALEPDREKMLREQIPQEKRDAAGALLMRVEKARKDPAAARPLSREWLRLFDAAPLNSRMAEDAREAVRVAGGPVTEADAKLYLAADVSMTEQGICLRYDSADALLADFTPVQRAHVLPGEDQGLRAASETGCLVLRGLHWTEISIDAEIRPGNAFALMAGWRNRFENFSIGLMPGGDGKLVARPPIPSRDFQASQNKDGWIRVSMALADGQFKCVVGGEPFDCEVPRSWTGEAALWFVDAFQFRRFEIRGIAEFREPDMDEEFAPLTRAMRGPRKDIAANWMDWVEGGKDKNKAVVTAGQEWKRIKPPAWNAGDNYHLKFKVYAGEGADMLISLRAGESRREILLADESANGFSEDGKFLLSGSGLKLPRDQWVQVDIQVHGNLAAVQVGTTTWFGHLEPLERGGIEVAVKGGTVTFADLKIQALAE
ncbi:MAG: protein kinase [Planctomycetota bacterium]